MPIGRNSFIQMTKLSNVKGRITYISSHAKQENLYAVYETTERKFWRELAKCNQEEFVKSGTEGKCIEARELIIALPESFTEYQPDRLLQLFTNHFKQNYGAECIAALHHNKRKTNYHIHLIFAERKLLDEPIIKTASRNMFYDENGKHVRTKKEILGEDGEIREGCRIVKKGEVYEKKLFTAKDERFKSNSFLDEAKHSYTDLINIYVQDESQKLQVFERGSVYLATKKIGKNNPKAQEIEADNQKRREWNRAVDMALISGVPEPKIMEVKRKEITEPIRESIARRGNRPRLFSRIVTVAVEALEFLMGAKQLISLLDYMDDSILEYENAEIPERVPSDDDIDTLVNIAIGSPAVCLYRNLKEIVDLEERKKIARECCDKSFVSMFNRPESRSIMDAVFEGKKGSSDEKHYEQVFHYCVDGNFQSMLDEYKFALGVCGEEFVEAIKDAFLQTTTLPYVSQEYYRASFTDRPQSKAPRLRVHFAAGYFDAKTSDKTIQRVNNVRNAFNSPFRPFVLATTSVGQEGLDFHLYSRKVVHWNLPSNPIDLEQREGRINRYMCHAIRQNVGANESAFDWKEKFDKTKEKYGKGTSDMIPYWCLPDEYPFKYQIERIVPMYPFGQDKTKYDRLINVLALYRLTLGQPRQEEMIAILQREDLSKEQMEELFFDLSPYSRNKKKQTLQW